MTGADLPELSTVTRVERIRLVALVLNAHGQVYVEYSRSNPTKQRTKRLVLAVVHEDERVPTWFRAALNAGRLSERRLVGILLRPEERRRRFFVWQLRREGEAKRLLNRVWGWLSPEMRFLASTVIQTVETWKRSQTAVKARRKAVKQTLTQAQPRQPKTGIWVFDDEGPPS